MTGRSAVLALGSDAERLQRPALRTAAGGIVALGGPAAVTLLAFGNPHEALPALLYVLVVLFAISLGGRGPGLVAAAVSIGPFYYFFLVPHHTWTVKSEGAVALAVFVLTGVLCGEVLSRQRGARTRACTRSRAWLFSGRPGPARASRRVRCRRGSDRRA